MTTLTPPPPPAVGARARRAGPAGGGLTLAERLEESLRAVRAHGAASCPVCLGEMALERGAGRCRDCGSRLD